MSDLKNYKCPPMFRYCDFADTKMPDGTLLTTEADPIVLNDGNIVFPKDWTNRQTEAYRRENNLQHPAQS